MNIGLEKNKTSSINNMTACQLRNLVYNRLLPKILRTEGCRGCYFSGR